MDTVLWDVYLRSKSVNVKVAGFKTWTEAGCLQLLTAASYFQILTLASVLQLQLHRQCGTFCTDALKIVSNSHRSM